jgi:K+-transporting ATPase KdpF subunit
MSSDREAKPSEPPAKTPRRDRVAPCWDNNGEWRMATYVLLGLLALLVVYLFYAVINPERF